MDDEGTQGSAYTNRLLSLEAPAWKRLLNVQAPYRRNVRRLCEGRVLEVGCGIGRNLAHLAPRGVGVDHNRESVQVCRDRGFVAYVPEDLAQAPEAQTPFDTMLMAHVLEHLDRDAADAVLEQYLGYLRPGGRVVVITPQERGFASDATHIRWVDHAVAQADLERAGVRVDTRSSFPLPRLAGRVFVYNEFVTVGHLPAAGVAS